MKSFNLKNFLLRLTISAFFLTTICCAKKEDSKIIEGHRLYYNFIKPHESLGGKTPSEEAGITLEGDNKWLTLMKNAVQYQKSNKK